jgi:hypothetical protein
VIVESSVINYLHQSYIFFITFPVDRGESKSSVGRGLYHERAGGVNLFLFRIYNIDFWQYGWLYPYVNTSIQIKNPRRQIFSFPASQGYIKASCKSFLGRVAMYVYKVVNGCIGFLFCSDKSCICS